MRKILVGILVGSSLALATSAAFADPESHGLGGQVAAQSAVPTATTVIVASSADLNAAVVDDSPVLVAHRLGDIENR